MLATVLLLLAFHGVQNLPETALESAIVDQALTCPRINPKSWPEGQPSRKYLLRLLRVERSRGVPREMQGFLLAMACHESGFNPNIEGDHKFSKHGRPMAIGLLQQWPWMSQEKYGYAIDRRDPYQATGAQAEHWVRQIPKTLRYCGRGDRERLWAIAQVRSVRRPAAYCLRRRLRARGHAVSSLHEARRLQSKLPARERAACQRCYERSRHYRIFKRWRKAWAHLLEEA